MAKHWRSTCFVVLALLGCLVEAQFVTSKKQPVPQSNNPQFSRTPQITPPNVSPPYPGPNCDVEETQRVPCGLPAISADACQAIQCCFDGRGCYYGKSTTVQCTKDGHFIVVVAKDATLPHLDLESISLLEGGQGCTHVDSNSGFAIYHFPVTSCGTIVTEEPGVIIYENKMSSSYDLQVGYHGVISRDSTYELVFKCWYSGTSVKTLVVDTLTINDPPQVAVVGPLNIELRLGSGQCNTKGCNEVDAAYSSYYTDADYPVTKVLRDPVYVEVNILDRTDPNLVMTLGRCWATASPSPHSLPQWDLLIDGCPYREDRYLSTLVPVDSSSGFPFPTHCKRFIFQMFTFVDWNSRDPLQRVEQPSYSKQQAPLKQLIYIHCSTAVCTAGPGHSCDQPCYRKHVAGAEAAQETPTAPRIVVSSGLVIMGAQDQ
ncbi:zona pellucida sperm-binding protein 4-like [Polymixia lowei]